MAARWTRKDDGSNWTVADSRGVYGIRHWGAGYFAINDGDNVEVCPQGADSTPIDPHKLVGQLCEAGLNLPLLVCFPDILQDRVRKLTGAFDVNIERPEYQSRYTVLCPIKANQQEAVMENITATENVSTGLEAGSKSELMAVLTLVPKGSTIVCNGYKDCEFIKLALMGQELGHNVFIVIEKESEAQLAIEEAANVGVQPQVSLRVRLSPLTSSKWADTGGEKAKLDLSAAQLLSVVEHFHQTDLDRGVCLLHFHMGSQITNLTDYRHGFKEAICYYGEPRVLGLPVDHIDVGGGPGVDYDDIHSRNASLISYDIDDYAGVVVGTLKELCDAQGPLHPHIFSESGRVLTAHHVVLITQVTGIERHNDDMPKIVDLDEQPEIVCWLAELLGPTDAEMVTETYWRVTHYIGDAVAQHADGKISLAQKALAEQCYFIICRRLHNQPKARQRSYRQVLDELNDKLVDKYICNFSVFQSLSDTQTIGQVLPILPLYRLGEEPDRRAVLQDLIYDSDGKTTQYVDERGIEASLSMHEVKEGEDYLIGVSLVGAYQEILGDMHNLSGDTDSANVYQHADGDIYHIGVEIHDTIEDILRYVHLSPEELMTLYRDEVAGVKLTTRERNQYLDTLRPGLIRSMYLP